MKFDFLSLPITATEIVLRNEIVQLTSQVSVGISARVEQSRLCHELFTKLRTENENLLAQIDERDDELDDAYNTIALYEEQEDLELDALLDKALDELFPGELHDRA